MNNRDIYQDEFGQYHEVADENVELIDGLEDDGLDEFDDELFDSSDDEIDDDEAYANEHRGEYDIDED